MKRTRWIFGAAIGLMLVLVARTLHVRHSLDLELISAVKRLDGPAVKTCLAQGANPNATDPETWAPLWVRALAHLTGQYNAAYNGASALAVTLLNAIDVTNQTINAGAPKPYEPTEIVNALLDKGANANVEVYPGVPGGSAIANAQASGYKQCVRMLLEHGARANETAFGGSGTLLTYAISFDDFDTVSELIKHGANVNAKDKNGVSPLAYGSFHYPVRQRIIKFLQVSGAHQ